MKSSKLSNSKLDQGLSSTRRAIQDDSPKGFKNTYQEVKTFLVIKVILNLTNEIAAQRLRYTRKCYSISGYFCSLYQNLFLQDSSSAIKGRKVEQIDDQELAIADQTFYPLFNEDEC